MLSPLATHDFPRLGERGRPAHDSVRALQHAVQGGLESPECRLELLRMEIERRDGEPGLAPFFFEPGYGVRVAFAYWGPGRSAGAHEHNDWTVTAVFHNQLEVTTFDWEATRRTRRLVPKNVFSATAGRVGHIYDPCVHDPKNPTSRWSISLHLFGPNDEPRLEREVGPIEGLTSADPSSELSADDPDPLGQNPLLRALAAHQRECVRRVQIEALTALERGAAGLLEHLYRRGDAGTRQRAACALDRSRRMALDPDAELVNRWRGVELDVMTGDRAELRAQSGGRVQPLLFVGRRARRALERIADASAFAPRELPGLSESEQIMLAQVLVDWGTFQPIREEGERRAS